MLGVLFFCFFASETDFWKLVVIHESELFTSLHLVLQKVWKATSKHLPTPALFKNHPKWAMEMKIPDRCE